MRYLITLLFLLNIAAPTYAVEIGWTQSPNQQEIQVRLEQAGSYNEEENYYPLLLHVKLAPEWKTYWRSPGPSGTPPKFNLSGSDNLGNVQWHWPAPVRFDVLGQEAIGYQNSVTFPLKITPQDNQEPVNLSGNLNIAACTNYCMQSTFPIDLRLNQHQGISDQRFQQAMTTTPNASSSITSAADWSAQHPEELHLTLAANEDWASPVVFVESQLNTEFAYQGQEVAGNSLKAIFTVESDDDSAPIDNQTLLITVIDAENQVASEGVAIVNQGQTEPAISIVLTLVYALIGGLVLNLMPCVLPVLGIKINSLLSSKEGHRKPLLMSALGIVLSFWLIGAFMLAVRWTGHQMGWGMQFQHTGFIAFMFVVTVAFALNLLGLFEIRLPSNLNTALATRTNRDGSMGHLLQGVFATLLATPCTAPFLGTAMTVALAANSIMLMAVFTGLGIGMALPWLILAALPSFNRYMPKPGRWMVTLKYVFGAMMLATSAWLLSLLPHNIGGIMGTAALLIVLFLLALTRLDRTRFTRKALTSAGALIVIVVIGSGYVFTTLIKTNATAHTAGLHWEPLDMERLSAAVAQGKTVFVDITADWCITCKVNKATVLHRDPVYSKLASGDVLLMQGDWSKANGTVDRFLSQHKQSGIPYNRVYGPSIKDGVGLSVILTAKEVMDAFERASLKSIN